MSTKRLLINKLGFTVQWVAAAGVCPHERERHLCCRALLHGEVDIKHSYHGAHLCLHKQIYRYGLLI